MTLPQLPACAACGVDDCWGVEGREWSLGADLRCTNCDTPPEGQIRRDLLDRFGTCVHAWSYAEEFGSLPIRVCELCGLANIDPNDAYAQEGG